MNDCLQVEGASNIFAGGDVCDLPIEKLAYAAIQHGVNISRNICRLEKGKRPLQFGEKGCAKLLNPPKAQMVTLATQSKIIYFFFPLFLFLNIC